MLNIWASILRKPFPSCGHDDVMQGCQKSISDLTDWGPNGSWLLERLHCWQAISLYLGEEHLVGQIFSCLCFIRTLWHRSHTLLLIQPLTSRGKSVLDSHVQNITRLSCTSTQPSPPLQILPPSPPLSPIPVIPSLFVGAQHALSLPSWRITLPLD